MQKTLAKLLRKDVKAVLAEFDGLWEVYGQDDMVEAVHEHRVAVNKLIGNAMFLGIAGNGKAWPAGLGGMRTWQKRLGPLRDTDVKLEWLEKIRERMRPEAQPAAEALREFLEAQRDNLRGAIILDAQGYPGAQARVAAGRTGEEFSKAVERLRKRAKSFDRHKALLAVAEPWAEALEELREHQHDEGLHDFRVKNKKFRFVLELLARPEEDQRTKDLLKNQIKTLKEVHTTLGNLSDLVVFEDRLRTCRALWVERGRKLEESAAALEETRTALEHEELERWLKLWPQVSAPGFLHSIDHCLR